MGEGTCSNSSCDAVKANGGSSASVIHPKEGTLSEYDVMVNHSCPKCGSSMPVTSTTFKLYKCTGKFNAKLSRNGQIEWREYETTASGNDIRYCKYGDPVSTLEIRVTIS